MDRGCSAIDFETDCQVLNRLVLEHSSIPRPLLDENVGNLKEFFSRQSDCSLTWIPSGWNMLPHLITKRVASRKLFVSFIHAHLLCTLI